MDFDFTETEEAFAEEVRRFLRDPPETFPIHHFRALPGECRSR
jgi:hypothetical protein